jgi:hypothetical protein
LRELRRRKGDEPTEVEPFSLCIAVSSLPGRRFARIPDSERPRAIRVVDRRFTEEANSFLADAVEVRAGVIKSSILWAPRCVQRYRRIGTPQSGFPSPRSTQSMGRASQVEPSECEHCDNRNRDKSEDRIDTVHFGRPPRATTTSLAVRRVIMHGATAVRA